MAREPSLVKLYMDLTGANESTARSVFMHVCGQEGSDAGLADEEYMTVPTREKPAIEPFTRSIKQAGGWLSEAAPVPTGG